MKRFCAIFLILVLQLGLCACGGKYPDLLKYKVITQEEANRGEFITYLEALEAVWNIKNLYDEETVRFQDFGVSSFGDLSADTQEKLSKLINDIYGPFLSLDELKIIEYAANLTRYKALVYATRLMPESFGCVIEGPLDPLPFTTAAETYEWAKEKGLISEIDYSTIDEPIRRTEFYQLLENTIHTPYTTGGYSLTTKSILDRALESRKYTEEKNKALANNPEMREISVDITYHDDLSISWVYPEDFSDYSIMIHPITKSGEEKWGSGTNYKFPYEDADSILYALFASGPDDLLGLDFHIKKTDSHYPGVYSDYAHFRIMLPKIEIVYEEEPIEPDTIYQYPGVVTCKEITLKEGYTYKDDAYYMISQDREDDGQLHIKALYNPIYTYYDSYNDREELNINGLLNDPVDLHLQEITITGNAQEGFILHITPPSEGVFKVADVDE